MESQNSYPRAFAVPAAVAVGVIGLFWLYPHLFVTVVLAPFIAMASAALYFVVVARTDARPRPLPHNTAGKPQSRGSTSP